VYVVHRWLTVVPETPKQSGSGSTLSCLARSPYGTGSAQSVREVPRLFPVPYGERARQDNVLPDPMCLGVSGTTVSQRCKTTYKPSDPASTAGKTGDSIRLVGIQRVKCRTKCFYETRSHGQQDQDFDGILRIHISRFLTSGIEPEPRSS